VIPPLSPLRLKAYLRYIASTNRPILIGPWRSEVGFETLYWLPFLRWAKSYAGFKADRCVVVTRGGAGVLYPHMRSVDLYSLRAVATVRQENLYDAQTNGGIQKQTCITPWDRDVLAEAAGQICGRGARYHVLHPSLMYRVLDPWWEQQRGINHLADYTEYQPLIRPAFPALQLPDRFVAVKWYARHTFPPTEAVKTFVGRVTANLATQMPVVLLGTGHAGDEHQDLQVTGPNIATLPAVPSSENLHMQLAVLARATAFVGTYGGMAQTALRMGVPSVSFYETWGGTALAHLTLSDWLARKTGVSFQVGHLGDAALWQTVLSVPAAPAIVAGGEGT